MTDVNHTTPMRKCKICGREFPVTSEYFPPYKVKHYSYLRTMCRENAGVKTAKRIATKRVKQIERDVPSGAKKTLRRSRRKRSVLTSAVETTTTSGRLL